MNSTKDNGVAEYVIKLIGSVVNGTQPPENSDIDWNSIICFARDQSVLNIIAYAAEKLHSKPDGQTMKYLEEFRMQKVVVEAQQELAAVDTCEELEKSGIKHMLLKGSVLKNYYPIPDMRTMSDIDILIDPEHCERIIQRFVDDGFTFVGEGDLHSNVKKGNVYIEFHHSMVDSCHEVLSAYYCDGFSRAHLKKGKNFEYELSNEDFYVFLIAHIAKHYRFGGTGIRSLLDIYVFENAVPGLNFDYIESELKKIGLLLFYKKVRRIAFNWYGGDFPGQFDIMSEYIVSGGVYGIRGTEMQNSYIFDHIDENIRFQKIKTLFKIAFLGYDEMKIRYPALENKKILLPVFWIIRFFETMIHSPENAKQRIEDSKKIMSIDDKMVEIQKASGIEKL